MVAKKQALVVSVPRPWKIVIADCILKALNQRPPSHSKHVIIGALVLFIDQDVNDARIGYCSKSVRKVANHRKPLVALYSHKIAGSRNHCGGMKLFAQLQVVPMAHLLSEVDQVVQA
jgi:hypothetical protein